jgi:DNA-binding transcriptional MerR regulator
MATTALDDVRLLRPRLAAQLLDVSPRQLDHLVKLGVIKPVRLVPGGSSRFRVADLAALAVVDNEED